MRALDRKLLRDLWSMRAHGLAIALVIAGGVATWVISLSTIGSLDDSRRLFYSEYRFADAFAALTRAPRSVLERIADLPGVDAVEGRIRTRATLTIRDFDEPVEALVTSIPDDRQPALNRIHLARGRLPDPRSPNEAVVADGFAEAHDLAPGDRIRAIIRGRTTDIVISGTGVSPAFVYQIRPGSLFPDHRRYAVMAMRQRALERAADMDGAFNYLLARLDPGAHVEAVIERIDDELDRWGGTGAIGRADQTSHSYLTEELDQLRAMARIVPVIFLGVAAFLLNIVIHRLIGMQREQIAILKAFGYSNGAIGLHYTLLVLGMITVGIVPGLLLGGWMGRGLASIYREFFRFPELHYAVDPDVIASAVLVTAAAALAGTWRALWQAFRLSPAEAMRPESPQHYRATLAERLPLLRGLDQPTRMILRNLERHPVKSLLAVIGIALAAAILVTGRFQQDTIDYMLDVQFGFAAREDLAVTFTEPVQRDALHELAALPGVLRAEPFRAVPVEFVREHRRERSAILAFEPPATLHRTLDRQLQPIRPPEHGVLLTDWLAAQLDVRAGEQLTVRILEGRRPTLQVPVAGTVREFVGASGYMRLDALNRLLGESDSLSGGYLQVDRQHLPELFDELERRPGIAASNLREANIEAFEHTMGENIAIFALVNTLLAGVVAFGVIYNTARLSLSERSRELASLRVLGFRRSEVAWILIGELAVLTLIAIPLGLTIGRWFCGMIGRAMASEFYRVPTVIHADSYAFAATVVLAAMTVSAVAIGRRLSRLDLVEVLKTRE